MKKQSPHILMWWGNSVKAILYWQQNEYMAFNSINNVNDGLKMKWKKLKKTARQTGQDRELERYEITWTDQCFRQSRKYFVNLWQNAVNKLWHLHACICTFKHVHARTHASAHTNARAHLLGYVHRTHTLRVQSSHRLTYPNNDNHAQKFTKTVSPFVISSMP